MPETKKTKPRDRTGYVMVELSPEDRASLDEMAGRFADSTGSKTSRAGALRSAVRAYRKNPEKFLRLLLTPS